MIMVTAEDTGQPLQYAHVVNDRTGLGKITDERGMVHIESRVGDTLKVSFVGYEQYTFDIRKDQKEYKVRLQLQPMEEVVVFAEEPFNRRAAEGRQDVPMEMLVALPAFNGDPDIMKAITFLPGVAGGKDGYSHFFVRGGGQDENLILLDGAPLYNVNHFGGFVSMFHSDLIQSVDFYKGYWPSQFGGRLSSVMDIGLKSGDFKKHTFSGDFSPLSVKGHISGPLWKDKVSYIVGGRRTFIDLILLRALSNRTRTGKRNGYSPLFTILDSNGKIDARINDHHHLSFSAFQGVDGNYYFENRNGLPIADNLYRIQNRNIALNYSYYPNASTTLKAHLSTSYYQHYFEDHYHRYSNFDSQKKVGTDYRNTGNEISHKKGLILGTTDIGSRWEWNYGMDHEMIRHDIYLDRYKENISNDVPDMEDRLKIRTGGDPAHVTSVFSDGIFHASSNLRIKAGGRVPRFRYNGFTTYMFEPKALISYDVSSQASVNAAYNHQQQYAHQLGYTENEGYFREFYILSDQRILPSRSDQWSMGWFYRFPERRSFFSNLNFSAEIFYKKQNRLNKFIPGIDPDLSVVDYPEYLLTDGTARTYGLELLFQKTAGKFHGSLSYTFANSSARFADLNKGKPFTADFDYRHNANILLIYKFRKGYQMSAQWDYRSGRPFTLTSSFQAGDDIISGRYPIVTEINNSRMPAYHRLDLSLDREWRTKRKGIKNWFGISIYNAYNRVNPFFAYPENGKLEVYGFFPIIPSFHYGLSLGDKKEK